MVCHYVGSFRPKVCASKPDATLPHLYKSTTSWLWCSIWPQTYRPAVIHGSISYVTLKMFIYEQLCLHAVQDKKKAGWIYCSSIGLFHNDDFKLFFIQIPTCIKLCPPPPPQCGQHSAMMLCTCNCSWLVSASSSSSLSSPTGEMLASVLRNSCFCRWTSPFLELNASYGYRRRD